MKGMQTIKITDKRLFTARTKPGKTAEINSREATLEITMTTETAITFADGAVRYCDAGDVLHFRFFGVTMEVEKK